MRIPMIAAAVTAIAVGTGFAGNAQQTWLQNGVPTASPATASQGGFGVLQVQTDDPQGFMANWGKPGAGVFLKGINDVPRNHPAVTFIVFRGCRPDPAGRCKVTADFEVLDPAGKVYDQTKAVSVWSRPPPAPSALELSEGGLGLRIEDKDALGVYRIKAAVTDHVAGVTLRTEQVLTAR